MEGFYEWALRGRSLRIMLVIRNDQLKRLEEEAEGAHPLEACALLFGRREGRRAVVEEVVVVPNEERSPVSFKVNPEVFCRAIVKEEGRGRSYLGIFHSHPAPESPSDVDLRAMERWPDLIWLIYSSITGNFGAYEFSRGRARRVTTKVV